MAKVQKKQAGELIKCARNPIYFINEYCKVVSFVSKNGYENVMSVRPFKLWQFQEDCINDFLTYKNNIILKSRQVGMSTLVAAYATWMFLFHPPANILIVATKQDVAKNLLRKVKVVISNLPKWMRQYLKVEKESVHTMESSRGSIIKAVATSDDVGVSEALSLLIVDEAAIIKNMDKLWLGLKPTISTGGRCILLSTPRGVGNLFHKLYESSAKKWENQKPGEDGCNNFNGIKLDWRCVPARDDAWFESQTKDMDEKEIAQEYECDFLSSGDTLVSAHIMKMLEKSTKNPVRKEGSDGGLWIWNYPVKGHYYVISADVASGYGKDYSAFPVIDLDSSECVAEYKGKIAPDRFAELLDEVGRKYNNALVAPERNQHGHASLIKLRDLEYPNIFYRDSKIISINEFTYRQDLDKAGFDTNGRTRNQAISQLEESLRNTTIKIYSTRLLKELRTFVWTNPDKAEAMRGYNDDLVMSYAIGSWLIGESGTVDKRARETKKIMLDSMGVKTTKIEDIKSNTDVTTGKQEEYSIFIPLPGSGASKIGSLNKRGMVQGRLGKKWKWLLE